MLKLVMINLMFIYLSISILWYFICQIMLMERLGSTCRMIKILNKAAGLAFVYRLAQALQFFFFRFQHPQSRAHYVTGRVIAATFYGFRYEFVKVIAQHDRGVAGHGVSPLRANIPTFGIFNNPPVSLSCAAMPRGPHPTPTGWGP